MSSGISFDATTTTPTGSTAPISDTTPTSADRTTPSEAPVDGVVQGEWRPASGNLEGLPSECGNLSYIWSDADRGMVIAGVALQGLWANEDGSDTWTQLGQGPGSDTISNRLTSIVRDPDHPDTFWESGTYAGGGVYRTDDNGQTFRQLGDVAHSDLVSVDLSDPDRATLLTGVHEQSGLFRSADGVRRGTICRHRCPTASVLRPHPTSSMTPRSCSARTTVPSPASTALRTAT